MKCSLVMLLLLFVVGALVAPTVLGRRVEGDDDAVDERQLLKRIFDMVLGHAPVYKKETKGPLVASEKGVPDEVGPDFEDSNFGETVDPKERINIYALRVNFSVAIVAMTNSQGSHGNTTTAPFADWDTQSQGQLLSAFFYGYIVTQIPGGLLANRIGGKWLYGCAVLITGIMTLLTPWAASSGYVTLMVIRIIEGFFEGVTYPCIHAIWRNWAPSAERTKLTTIAFSGSYVGTVFSLPLSAVLGKHVGWPAIFYVFGALAILWFIAWAFLVTETPGEHPGISQEELEYIQRSTGPADQKHGLPPLRQLVTSMPVWAIVVAHFAENWGFYTMLTELPSFMNDVLKFNLQQAGFLAAIPYLVMAIFVQTGGHIADFIRRKEVLSTTGVRKLFNCGAFVCQTVFMLVTAYVMTPAAAVTCLTIAVGLGGFAWSGFSVNHLDIAPQYASILMGISNTFATIPGIVSPSITGHLVPNKTADEWRVVFYIAGGIYLFGALFYGIFASGEIQPWAEVQDEYQVHRVLREEEDTDVDD